MKNISNIILNSRGLIISLLVALTILMVYYAYPPNFSYEMAKLLPSDHPVSTDFDNFTNQFWKNNENTITIAVQDSLFFDSSIAGNIAPKTLPKCGTPELCIPVKILDIA